ncbi:MAG: NAD(P)/FAD-dependent oxidoreductase [Methanomassiliicoccales archaeon]|nr:MAG: NAD(P)/FAD-dependent oxidoreductase [Methanomassiliicoccales archaeon]
MSDRMAKYDAVICGAGPSGSTAAKYMAEKGLKVVLLEKKSFPRDKPCGGALRPSIIEEFDYVRDGIKKIPHSICLRAKMYSPSLQNFIEYRPGKAVMYNIQRVHFDAMLADLARRSGAELRENAEVKSVSVKSNGCALQLKNGEEVEGNVILGAGGMHDPVAKYLRKKEGLPERWPRSDIGLGIVKEYEVGEDFIENRFGDEHTAYFHLKPNNLYGYTWTFSQVSSLNIGFGTLWNDAKKVNIKNVFAKYLDFLKKEGLAPETLKLGRPKAGLVPLKGGIKKSYSDRILILGDAAGFATPVGGDGIYFGMCSGRIAADVVEYAIEHNAFEKDTLSRYQEEWYKLWGEDLKAMCYYADKIYDKTERILRYASKDKVLTERCVGLWEGKYKASKMKWKIVARLARDFFVYDVLRL